MRTYIFKIIVFSSIIFLSNNGFAQSAKKYFKIAKELSVSGNHEEAIENYSKAIELDPKFEKAYSERALAYEETGDFSNAAEDYKMLTELLPNEYEWYYKAAKNQYKLNKYNPAIQFLNSASQLESSDYKIVELKTKCYIGANNFKLALSNCDIAIKMNPSAENYYLHGLIQKQLENYTLAEADFIKSSKLNPNYTDAYIGLTVVYFKQNRTDDALESVNKAIQLESNNKEALMLRSQIHLKNLDYNSALNDLSKLVSSNPKDTKILYQRGLAYFGNSQFENAIADFTKVIGIDGNNKPALFNRAQSYEKINKPTEAIKDYEKFLANRNGDVDKDGMYSTASKKINELSKESDSPVITIFYNGQSINNSVVISDNSDEEHFKITITDKSKIEYLMIDGQTIKFDSDSLSTGYNATLNIKNKKKFNIECADIHKNKSSKNINVIKMESHSIKFSLIYPLVSNNEVMVDPQLSEITIEGKAMDESRIESIQINGKEATFNGYETNPKFTAKLDISNTDKLEFTIINTNGISLTKTYRINRNPTDIANINPMGITWVVFIENSDYINFPSFKGPEKDVNMMKNALSKYQINNILHKKNLTKQQMERFFKSELKEMVRNNNVNSILIWYAGLGKLINEKSYWIPSDAKRDQEASYFGIGSLKSSMQEYSKNITHTLLVTDACETGTSFYMAMRSVPTDKDCSNTKSTKFKSSQVFSSSGYEKADENSQFSKTFANSLSFNSDGCIAIEKIVLKVSSAVTQNNNLKPKFGKIAGFEDENGTFIFIKKK